MNFCEQCGSLVTKVSGERLLCSCGHAQQPAQGTVNEKVKQGAGIEIVDRQISPLAVHEHKCKKCGYEKAEILTKGTIITDEDEFFLYKCGKCGFTEKADGLKVT